jgi:LysM repeat protein
MPGIPNLTKNTAGTTINAASTSVKIKITNNFDNTFFSVEYNPEEYTLSKDNNFAAQAIPGLRSPLLQYVSGNLRTLDMELLFDTWDSPLPMASKADVRDLTDQVVKLMDIVPDFHAPPVLTIEWASLQFTCVLAKVSQKFIMFTDQGTPVRARLSVTFQEFVTPEQEADDTVKLSSDLSKVHVVTQGETLSAIANRYYEDPKPWRPIAIANGLIDPRSIVPGQSLRIPPLPFTDPTTGEVVI